MPNVTGFVERREGKSIWVEGERYSAFTDENVKVNPGDTCSFEYSEKHAISTKTGTPIVYKNIKGSVYPSGAPTGGVIVPLTQAPASPSQHVPVAQLTGKPGDPMLHTQRLILRQNALTASVNFLTSCPAVLWNDTAYDDYSKIVIEMARSFEAYTSGDIDYQEVLNELDTLN